jgi:hypothetical protein
MRKSEDRAHLCPHFMAVKCHLRTYGRYLPRVGPKRETIVSLRLGFMVFRSIQFGFKKACGASISRLDGTFCRVNVTIDYLEVG